jgi:putative ABC transport system substrate-binding protein
MLSSSRRRFLWSTLAVAGLSLHAGCGLVPLAGQRSAGPRRVGFLTSDAGATAQTFEGLRDGLRDLGYVEGQDLLIEHRDAQGNPDRLSELAAELVALPVEVIVVPVPVAAQAARRATSTIPIVAAGGNVVTAGLVNNIAHPEGNITGVATNSVETVGKWVELLKETVPTISRIAVLRDPSGLSAPLFMQQVEHAAQALRLQARSYDLRDLGQLSGVLSAATNEGAEGLVLLPSPVLGQGGDPRIGSAVLGSGLPAIAEMRPFAVAGGLLAHGPNQRALSRRSASHVDSILKGAKPGDLPIELPTEFDIVVNLKTAGALGIAVPQSVLRRATEVIQ